VVDTVSRNSNPETLVRIAGDEFVVLLEDIHDVQDAELVAYRVLKILSEPYLFGGKEMTVSVSIGYVVPESYYDKPENIIRDADIAMYKAKLKGGACIVGFSQDMYNSAVARMQIENEMRLGIDRQEFTTYFQPIFALEDDKLMGFEALVRWNHPHRGVIPAKDFIDIAEETNMIVPIGYEILRQSCRFIKQLQDKYNRAANLFVSVNVSVRQLTSDDLIERVNQILDETGYDPRKLWLEITETTLIENLEDVLGMLTGLRQLGISIEIDDFGVGYSSLSYLQSLPIDGFKIDRSFVNKINGEGEKIVDTLVELGKSLKLMQVAEGVETNKQKDYLRQISCEYMQGYLMAHPMSMERIESYIDKMADQPTELFTPGLMEVE
jgi:EAL domain-containing protein (putative c-di-GMP-specific phosphodiesterase class I)